MHHFIDTHYRILSSVLLIAIAILSFYCGMLEGEKGRENPVVISCVENNTSFDTKSIQGGMFIGSKHGTKYYTPDCAGVERIKEENRIWFTNAEDATLQGYTAAAC